MNRALYLAGRMQVAFCQILAILCALTASASAAELTLTPSSDTSFHENAPGQVMTGRISRVVAERCERFANLCNWSSGPVASLKGRTAESIF